MVSPNNLQGVNTEQNLHDHHWFFFGCFTQHASSSFPDQGWVLRPLVEALIPKPQNTRHIPSQSYSVISWHALWFWFWVGVRGGFITKYTALTPLLLWCSRKMQSRGNINLNTVLPGPREMRTQPGHEVAGKAALRRGITGWPVRAPVSVFTRPHYYCYYFESFFTF